jgi:hypothetical protein
LIKSNLKSVRPKDDDDENTKGYESLCDETFKGWYFDGYKWGCYLGKKKDSV